MIDRKNLFSERLRDAMANACMKQKDLCRETDLDRSVISRYLAGEIEPKATSLFLLADALGVDGRWLLGLDVPKESATAKMPKENKNANFREIVEMLLKMDADELVTLKAIIAHILAET